VLSYGLLAPAPLTVKAEGEEEAEAEAAPEAEGPAEGEDGGPKVQLPQKTDYSGKALAYVAATHGQEWLVGRQLHRCAASAQLWGGSGCFAAGNIQHHLGMHVAAAATAPPSPSPSPPPHTSCSTMPAPSHHPITLPRTHAPNPSVPARPKATSEEEEGEEGAKAARAPVPVTFRLLDEQVPLLHVPVVASEPRITFFKPFPKIGAYLAAALRDPKGDYVSILAAGALGPGVQGSMGTDGELVGL
jgi:hypothetical protein